MFRICKKNRPPGQFFFACGPGGIRTHDLCVANAALSHLSYKPVIYLIFLIFVYFITTSRQNASSNFSKFHFFFKLQQICCCRHMHGQNQRQIHRPMPVRRLFYAGVRSTLGRQISFCLPVPPGRQTAGTVFDPCHRMLRRPAANGSRKRRRPRKQKYGRKRCSALPLSPTAPAVRTLKSSLCPAGKSSAAECRTRAPQKRPWHGLVLTIHYRSQLLKYTIKIYAAEARSCQ